MRSERLMRRPPDSDMPRQFLNDSVMNLWVGMVEMLLSQFWILTVWSAISMTSPLALAWGMSTQSPMRIMSLDMIWMLATSERMVSRKMRMRTAVSAPTPERKTRGLWSARIAMATMPAPR